MASLGKPSMEGFLEKHSTGVSRLLGKTRFWCTLEGSCLVYCKESKRSSVIESLLLGEAQMVRKTSSDRQGTQFEIVMKKQKTHVFTAASAEECSNWVRSLQQAMIHHEPGSRRSDLRRQIASDTGYEEIHINTNSPTSLGTQSSTKRQLSVPQSGIYADVVDAVKPKSLGFPRTLSNPSAGEYAEVADSVHRRPANDTSDTSDKSDKTESVVYRENSLYVGSRKENDADMDDMANGYTTLDNCQDMLMKKQAEAREEEELEGGKEETESIPEYAQVNKTKRKTSENGSQLPQPACLTDTEEDSLYENFDTEVKEGAAIENLDMELKRLPESPAPPVWNSITADDRKPLEDLKEFLVNNRQLCRPSYTRLLEDVDPFRKVKQLIQEIG